MPPFDSQQFQNPSSTGYYAPNQQQGMIGAALQDQFTSIMRSFKDELSFNMQTLNLTLSSLSSSMQNLSGKIGGLGPNTAGRYIDGGLNSGAFLGNISREFANYQPLSTTSFGLGIINSTRVRHPFNVSPLEYYMGSDIKRGMIGATIFPDLAQSALRAIPGAIETSGALAGMAGSMFGPVGMLVGGGLSLAAPYLAEAVRMGSQGLTDNAMLLQRMSGRASAIPFSRTQAFIGAKGLQNLMYEEIQNTTSMDTRLGFRGFRDITMLGLQGDLFKGNTPEDLVKQVKEASKVVKVFTEIMGSKDVKETMEALVQMKNMGVNFSTPGSSNFANNLTSSAAALGFNNSMSGSQMLKAGMQIAQSGYGTYGIPSGLGIGTAMQELASVTEMRKRGSLSDVQIAMGGGQNAIASRILGAQGNFLQSGFGTLALMNELGTGAANALSGNGFWGSANMGLNKYFSKGLGGIANFEANKTELMAMLTQDKPGWLDETFINHLRSSAGMLPGYSNGNISSKMDIMKLFLMNEYGLDGGAAETLMQSVISDFNKTQTLNAEYATHNSQVGSILRAKNTITARYFAAGPESFEKYITKKIHQPVNKYAEEWTERWAGIRKNYYDDGGNGAFFNDDSYTTWENDESGTRKIGKLDEKKLVNDIILQAPRWNNNIGVRDTTTNTKQQYIKAREALKANLAGETDPGRINTLKKQINVLTEKIEGVDTLLKASAREAADLVSGDNSFSSLWANISDTIGNFWEFDQRNSTKDLLMSTYAKDFIQNRANMFNTVRSGGSGLDIYDARQRLIESGIISGDSIYTQGHFASHFKESILRNSNDPLQAALDWIKLGKGDAFKGANSLLGVATNDMNREYFTGYTGRGVDQIDWYEKLDPGKRGLVDRLKQSITDGDGGARIREIFKTISSSFSPAEAQKALRYALKNADYTENKRFSSVKDDDFAALVATANLDESQLGTIMDAWGNNTTAKELADLAQRDIFDGSKIKTREAVEKYWRKVAEGSGIQNASSLFTGLSDKELKELYTAAQGSKTADAFRSAYASKYKGRNNMLELMHKIAHTSSFEEFIGKLGGANFFTVDENLKKYYGVQLKENASFDEKTRERLAAHPEDLIKVGLEKDLIMGANKEVQEKFDQINTIAKDYEKIGVDTITEQDLASAAERYNKLFNTNIFSAKNLQGALNQDGSGFNKVKLGEVVKLNTTAGIQMQQQANASAAKTKWNSRIDSAVHDTKEGIPAVAVFEVSDYGSYKVRDQIEKVPYTEKNKTTTTTTTNAEASVASTKYSSTPWFNKPLF